ncbi:MAG: oligosaccharide repeat unit polymerase [Clostridia bacterium]|nr:oligosaccharide repeat unit polymerase [Clostridia bacterium]MBQ7289145.1 oligosaccharide repeat unit polymerase [Clostridia bacterium]
MEKIAKNKGILINRIIAVVASVLLLTFGMIMAEINQFVTGTVLVVGAVLLYFFMVNKISDKNYLSFSAVFNAVWIATIGLAQLRLLSYQKIWSPRTWISVILTTVFMQIAIPFGHKIGKKIFNRFYTKKSVEIGRVKFEFKKQRLFWICLISTIVSVILFVWNIFVKGYVPFFSTMFNAYAFFYTKRMVFVTAACVISPIAYWCIKKCELAKGKKIWMYICIAINTFIVPILQVNRGVFVVAALMLTAAIFFLNGKKFLVLLLCLVVTFGFYEVGSVARNYTNEYLISVFEPTKFNPSDEDPDSNAEDPDSSDPGDTNAGGFQLPAKLSFLYGYFTISHDNFNHAVINASEYTYGVRQLSPFNVILRSQAIYDVLGDAEFHMIKPNLNTANLISGVYYDLREFGVILFVTLWGLLLGAIEMLYLKSKGVFALAALGNALTPVVLSFFASWFENFTLWLFWGTIFLIMLLASITITPKTKKQ